MQTLKCTNTFDCNSIIIKTIVKNNNYCIKLSIVCFSGMYFLPILTFALPLVLLFSGH